MSVDLARHAEIKTKLAEQGISLSSIARKLEVAPETLIIVSQGHRKSNRIQTAIAQALGVTPQKLFPERYENTEVIQK